MDVLYLHYKDVLYLHYKVVLYLHYKDMLYLHYKDVLYLHYKDVLYLHYKDVLYLHYKDVLYLHYKDVLYLHYKDMFYFTAAVFLILIHKDSKGIQTAYHHSLRGLFRSQIEVQCLATNYAFISLGYDWIGNRMPKFNDVQKKQITDFIKNH